MPFTHRYIHAFHSSENISHHLDNFRHQIMSVVWFKTVLKLDPPSYFDLHQAVLVSSSLFQMVSGMICLPFYTLPFFFSFLEGCGLSGVCCWAVDCWLLTLTVSASLDMVRGQLQFQRQRPGLIIKLISSFWSSEDKHTSLTFRREKWFISVCVAFK